MNFSNGELTVMEMLWEGECLDENGDRLSYIKTLKKFKIY